MVGPLDAQSDNLFIPASVCCDMDYRGFTLDDGAGGGGISGGGGTGVDTSVVQFCVSSASDSSSWTIFLYALAWSSYCGMGLTQYVSSSRLGSVDVVHLVALRCS